MLPRYAEAHKYRKILKGHRVDTPESYYNYDDWTQESFRNIVEMIYLTSNGTCGLEGDELLALWEILHEYEPKNIFEIGNKRGVSTKLFAIAALKFGGRVVSFDGVIRLKTKVSLHRLGFDHVVEFREGYIPWIELDPNWEIDFLFIDGDHSYTSALVDYHLFNYYLNKGGVVAFHDIDRLDTRNAMKVCVQRDNLKKLKRVGKVAIYEKTQEPKEVYFQVLREETGWYRVK